MARRSRPAGLRRAWGMALWVVGAVIVLAGLAQLTLLVLSQEQIVAQAARQRVQGPSPPALLEPAALPAETLSAALSAYPEKPRNAASPWGCAAFDQDQATPGPLAASAAAVTVTPRPARRDLVGYRLVSGQATDTLIPDLDYFASCLEQGRPEQVIETPARRSSPAFPASRWAMDAVELDAEVALTDPASRPARLRLEVARSRPDFSPYVEALPVAEPFGAVWLLDHGAREAGAVQVMGRLAPAQCEAIGEAGAPPRFQRFAYDPDAVGPGEPAAVTDLRRRLFDLTPAIALIPEAAAMAAFRACEGEACETETAFRARHEALAAAGWCDVAGGSVWRLRLDARLTAPNPAAGGAAFISTVSALVALEPPGPLTAAPVYRPPAPGDVGLRSAGEGYAIAAALPAQAADDGRYRVRLRLAAPETSTHLFRVVALDAAGAPLGASRWVHLLAFVPQAAAPAPVAAAISPPDTALAPAALAPAPLTPPRLTPVTPAAAAGREAFAAAEAGAQAPLPNP